MIFSLILIIEIHKMNVIQKRVLISFLFLYSSKSFIFYESLCSWFLNFQINIPPHFFYAIFIIFNFNPFFYFSCIVTYSFNTLSHLFIFRITQLSAFFSRINPVLVFFSYLRKIYYPISQLGK